MIIWRRIAWTAVISVGLSVYSGSSPRTRSAEIVRICSVMTQLVRAGVRTSIRNGHSRRTVVSGHLPSLSPSAPVSIVAEIDENDIVGAAGPPEVISAYQLRASPALLAEMMR